MKENILMDTYTAMVCLSGQMVVNTRVNGKTISNMVKVSTSIKRE
jgi:hypothetical protein